jgi:mannosyltransferase
MLPVMGSLGRRSPAAALAAVAGLTVVALALRLPSFGDALWGDELSTNFVVYGFGMDDVLGLVGTDQENTPPLFYLLTWLTKGFGQPEGLRVVSLLAGLAAIPLTYLLGKRTVGEPAALVGAALVALSPFQIFYATEARAYALVMALGLLAAVTLLLAIERGRIGWWVAFGLSVAATAYSHYTGMFVLIALFCWALVAHPEARRPLILATIGALVLFLPWWPDALQDLRSPTAKLIEVLHPGSLDAAFTDLGTWAVGTSGTEIGDVPGTPGLILIVAGLLVGAAGLALGWRAREDGARPGRGLTLVLLLALAAPVGAVVAGVFGTTVLIPRNLIVSWPALALAAGALVTAVRPPLRLVAVGLLLCGFAVGAVKMLDEDNRRPAFEAALDYIRERAEPGSPVVEANSFTPGPQWTLEAAAAPSGEPAPDDLRIVPLAGIPLEERIRVAYERGGLLYDALPPGPEHDAELAARLAGSGPVFLVVSNEDTLDAVGAGVSVDAFMEALPAGFEVTESRTFPGVGGNDVTVRVLRRTPG